MDLDYDLRRDAAASFGPASVTSGAMLPYAGRALLTSADGLPVGVLAASEDGWLSPDAPVLVRGRAAILPLAWRGAPVDGGGGGVRSEEIDAFASQMQAAGMQWAGPWHVPDLDATRRDSIGSYVAALRDAGATRTDWWTYSETVGLALVWAGTDEQGTRSLALHVVPASWVSEPRAGRPVDDIDVRWSWVDVSGLYAGRSAASGSRGTARIQTRQRSTSGGPCTTSSAVTTGSEALMSAEEEMEDRMLSDAIIAYLGKGRSPFPRTDEAAVVELAGATGTDGAELLARVRAVVDEMMSIQVDWSTSTLSQGGREAQRVMAGRHAELGQDALEALYWMFTYNWR